MSRVVVGVDDSPGARAALVWALDEAERRDARVEAIHAYFVPSQWIDSAVIELHRWIGVVAEAALQELDRVVSSCPSSPELSVERRAIEGDPAAVLLEAARDADMLVVGTRGRGGFAGLVLGSVSHRCAQHAPCPVVVVPSPR